MILPVCIYAAVRFYLLSSMTLGKKKKRKKKRDGAILLHAQCSCFLSLSSVAKHLESANTMFSFIWWIIGFYWVSAGGQSLARASPQLYWFARSLSLFHSFV